MEVKIKHIFNWKDCCIMPGKPTFLYYRLQLGLLQLLNVGSVRDGEGVFCCFCSVLTKWVPRG